MYGMLLYETKRYFDWFYLCYCKNVQFLCHKVRIPVLDLDYRVGSGRMIQYSTRRKRSASCLMGTFDTWGQRHNNFSPTG
jgi:hypothetical protein